MEPDEHSEVNETQEKQLRDTIIAYKSVFNSDDGQRVLEDLKAACCYNSALFSDNSLEMARNEGARQVVLRILKLLSYGPKELKELNRGQPEGGSDE